MGDCYIINRGNIDAPGRLPMFKYTGEYILIEEGVFDTIEGDWAIKFLTSGEFTPAKDMDVWVWPESHILFQEKIALTARTSYAVICGDDVNSTKTVSFGDVKFRLNNATVNACIFIRGSV